MAFSDEQTVAVFSKVDDGSLERSAVSGHSAAPVTFFA